MKTKPIIDEQSKKNLKRFFRVLFKYKKEWITAVALLILTTLMKLPMPLLTGYIIDHVISKGKALLLNYLCGGLVIITIVYLVLSYVKDYVLFCAQNTIIIKIKLALLEHIQNLTVGEISTMETGYLLARILNDPASLSGLFFQTLLATAQSVITLIVGTAVIFTINWRLALISLFILPFFVSSNLLFITKIKYWNQQVKEKRADISRGLKESLSAVKITKLFGLHKKEAIKFLKNMKEEFRFSKKEFNLDYIVSLASGFFSAMGPLLVVWYGGHEIIKGNLSIGQLVAFSALLGFLYNPTQSLLNFNVNFQKSLVSLNRVFEIIDLPGEEESQTKEAVPGKFALAHFNIEYKDVSFSYNDPETVLKDIGLQIGANESVAVLGPTGAGKSTLVNLLARFSRPDKGSISIGGRNIEKIPLRELRSYMGIVTQEDFLYSTTIYDNIRIGNFKATRQEIINAAKLANAHDFIQALPAGYETVVGEGGEFLSGGQRQLISIARVILKNPPILILDEPTSAVDSRTETLIQETLRNFMKGRITIIISHRLSTILNADRIVILEKGEITEGGTHEELIVRNDFYKKIYENQIKSLSDKQGGIKLS